MGELIRPVTRTKESIVITSSMVESHECVMKVKTNKVSNSTNKEGRHGRLRSEFHWKFRGGEFELSRWDPKGGDLCLRRVKAEEIPGPVVYLQDQACPCGWPDHQPERDGPARKHCAELPLCRVRLCPHHPDCDDVDVHPPPGLWVQHDARRCRKRPRVDRPLQLCSARLERHWCQLRRLREEHHADWQGCRQRRRPQGGPALGTPRPERRPDGRRRRPPGPRAHALLDRDDPHL